MVYIPDPKSNQLTSSQVRYRDNSHVPPAPELYESNRWMQANIPKIPRRATEVVFSYVGELGILRVMGAKGEFVRKPWTYDKSDLMEIEKTYRRIIARWQEKIAGKNKKAIDEALNKGIPDSKQQDLESRLEETG